MNIREIKLIYNKVLPNVNPLTPCVIEYINIKNYIIEVSKSHFDIRGNECLYGVSTIVNKNGEWVYDNEHSKALNTKNKAYKFIEDIKNGIN